jgi:hypothetical protein
MAKSKKAGSDKAAAKGKPVVDKKSDKKPAADKKPVKKPVKK